MQKVVKAWREGKQDSEELMGLEIKLKKMADASKLEKVEKWLRGGGEYRGGDGKIYSE